MEKKIIKIDDIILWDENPRFPESYFKKSEKELIQYIFNKKGEKEKIVELAKTIIKNFDLTPWEDLIVWNTGKQRISLEGNRRVMVYKILLNPNLLDEEEVRGIFEKGKKQTGISKEFSVGCIETFDKELALRYVELKHLESGYKRWGGSETANFERRRGKKGDAIILKTEIHKIVRNLDVPREILDKILGQGFVSTFDRLMTDSVAKEHFGFKISGEDLSIIDGNFKNKLKVIIWNLLNKKTYKEIFYNQKEGQRDVLNSRTLNAADNRKKYLESIDQEAISLARREIKYSVVEEDNVFGEKINSINIRQGRLKVNPKSISRKTLIPNRNPCCSLIINQGKINLIFRELRDDLLLDKTVNAIGVLFRVFLESTLDFFAEEEGLRFKNDIKLKGKVTLVADVLENKYSISKSKLANVRKVATLNSNILSIQNFHDYVHEIKVTPKPADLILKWDELQEFFEIVYNDILKGKK